jgi:Ser/Thr protein kinase RdoA (MazF antagonist)
VTTTVPGEVLSAWGWAHAEVTAIPGGLINATFAVRDGGTPRAVLQRLHSIFDPTVTFDTDAVTAHLASRGMTTPRLLRTLDDRRWFEHQGASWRALTWVDGETVHRIPDPAWAETAGGLVGQFHREVADLSHTYAFARLGVHDTTAHLGRLADQLSAPVDFAGRAEAVELASEILDAARTRPDLPVTPRRHCHGDLKISNVLFRRDVASAGGVRAVCLLDLDTLGLSTIAYELGDAMRSWCNPRGEDAASVTFELPIFAAAMRGFRATADGVVTHEERRSIVFGLETVCVELAARFCVDVFRDDYFGWDASRFPSRRAHNLTRAKGQITLALAVRNARAEALEIVG